MMDRGLLSVIATEARLVSGTEELQGTVELGVLTCGLELRLIEVDLDVGLDTNALDNLLFFERKRSHPGQIDIDGRLVTFADMTHVVFGERIISRTQFANATHGTLTDVGTVLHVPDDRGGYLGHAQ